MSRRLTWPGCACLLAGSLVWWAGCGGAAAGEFAFPDSRWLVDLLYLTSGENVDPSEPYWLRLGPTEASLGMEVEGLKENVRVGNASSTHEQLSLTPLLGLRKSGSIYHPNLFSFDLNGDLGWNSLNDKVSSAVASSSRDQSGELLRYLVQVNLLAGKPYNAIFSASQDHTFRNYDSFSTYTVDTTRYSGRVGWNAENWTLNADAGYRDEASTGNSSTSDIAETYANFSAVQKRTSGQSSLNYRYDEFDSIINFGAPQNSVNHSIGISDSEVFGRRRQIAATTGASYSVYDYAVQAQTKKTETVTLSEQLTIKLRPKLETYSTVNFSHSSMDAISASALQGESGVRHRLYESLTSVLEVHGSDNESSSASSSGANSRYGLGLHEDYTKRLAKWGRLTIGGALVVDHEDFGGVVNPLDEHHVLYLTTSTNYQPAYLNNPRVIVSTIEVRSLSGLPAQLNLDYEILPRGQLTEIRLLMGGTVLHNGDEVIVNYRSEPPNAASFESMNGSGQVRLDLFGKFGIYGRVNWLDNNAPPEALTQTLIDLVGGADLNWRWFRAGAEFEDHDSNFNQYKAWRFYESFTCQTAQGSTLNVDLTQNFYRYPDDNSQDRYLFITRYSTPLPFSLAWTIEGGYSLQEVMGTEQNFGFARTGLTWNRGKLTARAGYEYNYQTTITGPATEQRDRHRFYVYLKRTF